MLITDTATVLSECEVEIESSCNNSLTAGEELQLSECKNATDKFRLGKTKNMKEKICKT